MYGRLPPPLLYYGDTNTINSTLDQQLKERDIAFMGIEGAFMSGSREDEEECRSEKTRS